LKALTVSHLDEQQQQSNPQSDQLPGSKTMSKRTHTLIQQSDGQPEFVGNFAPHYAGLPF
jgi:hypothetical protein